MISIVVFDECLRFLAISIVISIVVSIVISIVISIVAISHGPSLWQVILSSKPFETIIITIIIKEELRWEVAEKA